MKFLIFILITLSITNIQGQHDVNFRVSLLDAPVLDIVWCGSNQNDDYDVLLLTNKGSLYRSGDRGDNWEKQSDNLNKQAVQQLQDTTRKIGVVNRMLRSPVNPYLVIFLGSEGINWITEDCGQSYKAIGTDRNFREFTFHPYEKDWILASSWSVCKEKSDKPCHVTKELYVSVNLGKSWDKLTNYIVQFNWGMKSKNNSENIPKQRILWSQELNAKGHQRIQGWNSKTHLYYSDDFLKTRKMIVSSGNKFLLSEQYMFVAQVSSNSEQNVNLLVANPNSLEYEFKFTEVEEELKQHSFTILDNTEGQVFLNINHLKGNSPMGTIYESDSTGSRFAKSLINNVRDPSDGQCDFEKVQGLDGIFIANVYDNDKSQRYKDLVQGKNDEIQYEKASTKQGSDQRKGALLNGDSEQEAFDALDNFKKTKISFDKGGIWKNINPPLKDVKGNKYQCDVNKDCSLNLHSVSSKMKFGPFYSTESAIGIIMGTGNVGKYLVNRPDQINTYLSRDGGLTWFEVRKGSHIYEIGDHGAILVASTDQEATNKIIYSTDEGISWSDLKFGEQSIEINNIITEPSNTAQRFIAYGETVVESNSNLYQQGVVVTLDFSNYFQTQCVGADTPDKDDSDYELWTPNGKISPNCLLGKKVTYARRKRDARCFNGEQFDRKITVEQCECTEEDWECDIGFSRVADGPCEHGKEIDYSPPEQCNGYYMVSQGYRKVAGDQCQGGVDHHPIKLPCPMFGIMSSNNLYNFFIIVGGLLIVYILYQKKEDILQTLAGLGTAFAKKNEGNSRGGYGSASSASNNSAKYGKNQQVPPSKAGYVDFSKMDFEKNEGGQFDDSLIEQDQDSQKAEQKQENLQQATADKSQQQQQQGGSQFNPRD